MDTWILWDRTVYYESMRYKHSRRGWGVPGSCGGEYCVTDGYTPADAAYRHYIAQLATAIDKAERNLAKIYI